MTRILAITLNPSIDIACATDKVHPMLKTRTRDQMLDPGGGGTNVARVIAALGGSPELVYLSGGSTGALYDSMLEELGLNTRRFPMAGSVRVSVMVREKVTDLEYRFVAEGAEVSEAELAPLMAHVEAFEGDYIIASGSLPRNVPVDTYARMAASAEKKGIRFILDTAGEALRETLKRAGVFLLKPSLHELELFVGRKLDEREIGDAATELVTAGKAENVAVSLGREGALLANDSGVLRVPSLHVKAVSAVGAGDSFVAAMTWRLSQGHDMSDAFRFGVAAGAAAVMTEGTQLCRREDVYALYETMP
ncbi:MAG: 1-phosphofructokinase family hexose kinase [Brucellaceae bacterium]|nr:1-phosphofructokinase family hexose kinase [Brucellaceae bacterium]